MLFLIIRLSYIIATMYHTYIFIPLYNMLIGIMDLFPWMDIGVAVIVFTCVVKFILFPLSKKAIISQIKMKAVEPKVAVLREKYKSDQKVMGQKLMELYKENNVNPFSMLLPILIQFPIIIAMYSVFANSGLPVVNESYLYSFIHVPVADVNFLGLIDTTKTSLLISVLVAVSQFAYLQYNSIQQKKSPSNVGGISAGSQASSILASSAIMDRMKYIFPVIIFIISLNLSAAIGIYWVVSNLFTLGQDYWVRHSHSKKMLKLLEVK